MARRGILEDAENGIQALAREVLTRLHEQLLAAQATGRLTTWAPPGTGPGMSPEELPLIDLIRSMAGVGPSGHPRDFGLRPAISVH